jgi:hypothetical protein
LSVENLYFGILVFWEICKLCPGPLGGPQGGTQGSKRMLS